MRSPAIRLRCSLEREGKVRQRTADDIERELGRQAQVLLECVRACDRPIATQAWTAHLRFGHVSRTVEVKPQVDCHSQYPPHATITISSRICEQRLLFSVHVCVMWRSRLSLRSCHKAFEGEGVTLAEAYDACLESLSGRWAASVRSVLKEVVE